MTMIAFPDGLYNGVPEYATRYRVVRDGCPPEIFRFLLKRLGLADNHPRAFIEFHTDTALYAAYSMMMADFARRNNIPMRPITPEQKTTPPVQQTNDVVIDSTGMPVPYR